MTMTLFDANININYFGDKDKQGRRYNQASPRNLSLLYIIYIIQSSALNNMVRHIERLRL